MRKLIPKVAFLRSISRLPPVHCIAVSLKGKKKKELSAKMQRQGILDPFSSTNISFFVALNPPSIVTVVQYYFGGVFSRERGREKMLSG